MITFVTGNEGKVEEAEAYLDEPVKQVAFDYTEIQADTIESVAVHGAREAAQEIGTPLMVDDSGLYINAFDGFPGPYSAYVENKLGIERVHQLTKDESSAKASFRSVIAYATDDSAGSVKRYDGTVHDDDDPTVVTFTGRVDGRIVPPRGDGGFGYDPIFEHGEKTFAELTAEEKNAISHRGRALGKLADWLEETQ